MGAVRGRWGVWCGLLGAAAEKAEASKVVSLQDLLDGGKRIGLSLENPFDITPEMADDVDREVAAKGGSTEDRLRRLTHFLNDLGYVHFQYVAGQSLTAIQAFEARRGDCMAYSNLFVGLARHLQIPVYFIHISETRNYSEREGLSFVSSHMAAGCTLQYYTVVVDLTGQGPEYSLSLYDATDDATAVGLFYNNEAVGYLLKGEVLRAEKLLGYLVAELPDLKEAYNNLGVVLLRQGRYAEALKVLQEAVARFPDYQPLYINVTQAAKGAGRPELALSLEKQGEKRLAQDPFFLFSQGLARFLAKDYLGAVPFFKQALARQPGSPVLYAWIARAYLAEGREREGKEAFARAQFWAPMLPFLKSLRLEYPVLKEVPFQPVLKAPKDHSPFDQPLVPYRSLGAVPGGGG
jgi:tetratricopeptide (TPR) repeat protein